MTPRSPLRRLFSLLLAGGVVSASTGFAIHDPGCPHHAKAAPTLVGAPHVEGAGHGHHQGQPADAPAPDDCHCLGFCALAGTVQQSLVSTPGVALSVPALFRVAEQLPGSEPVPAASSALQPPATGPPHVA